MPATLKSIILFILSLMLYPYCAGQGLTISAGTVLTTTGGYLTLKGDLANNGSCININSTIVFFFFLMMLGGTTPVFFDNLIVDEGSSVTITTPGQSMYGILLCDGTLNTAGYLTLLSSDSLTALIDGSGTGQVYGNITMQRYLPSGFGYKYFSSPFQAAQVSEFSDNMKLADPFPAFYRYDESRTTSGWVTYIEPEGMLNPMEGYAINFGDATPPIIFDVSGVVSNGPVSKTLSNHNNTYTQGFSLVGNPYPSPVDWDAASGWTRTNIDDAVYFFEASTIDQYGGSYVTYIEGVSSNGLATNLIPSMQGFFVHVTDGAWPVTGTFGIDNNVRVNDLTHPLIKSGTDTRPLIRLTTEYKGDTLSVDPVVIYFDEKATDKFDGQLDALKLMNTDFMATNLYTIGSDGRSLSISALPPISDTLYKVSLGLRTELDGNIIFKIRTLEGNLTEMEIYLSDTLTKTRCNLITDKFYEVSLPAGQYENRFFLEFRNPETGIPDYPAAEDDQFEIYSSHGILNLEIKSISGGTLMLSNLAGQILSIEKYYSPGNYEFNLSLKSGVYIASFTSGTKRFSKKLIVRNR